MASNVNITRKLTSDESGFTLTETIVAFAIFCLLVAVVVGAFAFGTRMMNQQRIQTNADMLCSMLSESVEDALTGASNVSSSDGSTVEFTSSSTSTYRTSGTYRLYTSDGKLFISKPSTGQTSSLIPDSSYIDGLAETCSFSSNASSVTAKITITDASGNKMAENEISASASEG